MKRFTFQQSLVVLGFFLLIGGSVLLTTVIRSRELSRVAAPTISTTTIAPAPTDPSVVYGNPVSLQIASLNIEIPIVPGYYNPKTQDWTLTKSNVQYATVTPMPNNQSGNTFLYGHARAEVFANLHNISPNAVAVVRTENGHSFYYRLNGVRTVKPADSAAVLTYQGRPILTLQTCSGLFWQNRQLFFFDLEKVV